MFMSDDATINLYICTFIIKNKDRSKLESHKLYTEIDGICHNLFLQPYSCVAIFKNKLSKIFLALRMTYLTKI